jgi:hypothetical protein
MRRSIWFWLLIVVLVVLLLGVIFGGYRKGAKIGAPDDLHLGAVAATPSDRPTVAGLRPV